MKNKEFTISAGTEDVQWIIDLAKLVQEKGIEPVGKAMGRYMRLVNSSTPNALRYLETTFVELENALSKAINSSNNQLVKNSATYLRSKLPALLKTSKGALLDAGQILKNAPNAGKVVLKSTLEGFGFLLRFFKFFGDGPPHVNQNIDQKNKTATTITSVKKTMGMSM